VTGADALIDSLRLLFGQGRIGESHDFDSVFTDSGGAQTSASSFALEAGGGFDWRVSRRFAVRPIEANWLCTQFNNGSITVQNNLPLGAGVVQRLR
jgi:peptidoglycan-associated lipoprotein